MTTPKLKLTFLGSGSAFTIGEDNYQSNVVIHDMNSDTNLLIDCGGDARFSLHEQGLSSEDIDAVYISHIHADHIGGLEWLGLTRHFNQKKQPNLFLSNDLTEPLWETLKGGMATLEKEHSTLNTFFDLHEIAPSQGFIWQNHHFKLEPTIHVFDNGTPKPCYGLVFTINDKTVFYTADSLYCYEHKQDLFKKADIIFHDCETVASKSGVHCHYQELLAIPAEIRNKIWLYHYNPGPKPDPTKDGFYGFIQKGQSFLF